MRPNSERPITAQTRGALVNSLNQSGRHRFVVATQIRAALAVFIQQHKLRTMVLAGPRKGFVGAAVDVITTLIGSESVFPPLLKQLGLADLGSITGVGESPVVKNAVAAVASVSSGREESEKLKS